jgi:hypothetical protein
MLQFTEFIFILLASIGFNLAVTVGSIFGFFRLMISKLGEMPGAAGRIGDKAYEGISCPQCFGFWAGIIIHTAYLALGNEAFIYPVWFSVIMMGLATSGLSTVLWRLVDHG